MARGKGRREKVTRSRHEPPARNSMTIQIFDSLRKDPKYLVMKGESMWASTAISC